MRGSMTKQSVGFPHVIASQRVGVCGGVKQSVKVTRHCEEVRQSNLLASPTSLRAKRLGCVGE